jgi:hypothetical protein
VSDKCRAGAVVRKHAPWPHNRLAATKTTARRQAMVYAA